MESIVVSMTQACSQLDVGRKTITRMVAQGLLPKPRRFLGRRQMYFDHKEFEKAVKKGLR
jgi:excisionase family DNA binding protein